MGFGSKITGSHDSLANQGRFGDTFVAHINPDEANLLTQMRGAPPSINPMTGLLEFFEVDEEGNPINNDYNSTVVNPENNNYQAPSNNQNFSGEFYLPGELGGGMIQIPQEYWDYFNGGTVNPGGDGSAGDGTGGGDATGGDNGEGGDSNTNPDTNPEGPDFGGGDEGGEGDGSTEGDGDGTPGEGGDNTSNIFSPTWGYEDDATTLSLGSFGQVDTSSLDGLNAARSFLMAEEQAGNISYNEYIQARNFIDSMISSFDGNGSVGAQPDLIPGTNIPSTGDVVQDMMLLWGYNSEARKVELHAAQLAQFDRLNAPPPEEQVDPVPPTPTLAELSRMNFEELRSIFPNATDTELINNFPHLQEALGISFTENPRNARGFGSRITRRQVDPNTGNLGFAGMVGNIFAGPSSGVSEERNRERRGFGSFIKV